MSSKDGLQRFVDLEGELNDGFNVINGKIVLSSKIREAAATTTSELLHEEDKKLKKYTGETNTI